MQSNAVTITLASEATFSGLLSTHALRPSLADLSALTTLNALSLRWVSTDPYAGSAPTYLHSTPFINSILWFYSYAYHIPRTNYPLPTTASIVMHDAGQEMALLVSGRLAELSQYTVTIGSAAVEAALGSGAVS